MEQLANGNQCRADVVRDSQWKIATQLCSSFSGRIVRVLRARLSPSPEPADGIIQAGRVRAWDVTALLAGTECSSGAVSYELAGNPSTISVLQKFDRPLRRLNLFNREWRLSPHISLWIKVHCGPVLQNKEVPSAMWLRVSQRSRVEKALSGTSVNARHFCTLRQSTCSQSQR
jgi:hypothetical protein